MRDQRKNPRFTRAEAWATRKFKPKGCATRPATMDSPGQVSNEFRRKLREEGKSKREQLLDSSKIATGYKFSAPQLPPRIQPGFFTASFGRVGVLISLPSHEQGLIRKFNP
jgi:hypothetical protein